MYAIETYFIPPTNSRGARIKARVMEGRTSDGAPARSLTLPWNYALGMSKNHVAACEALATRLGWSGEWIEGGGADGASVWINSHHPGAVAVVAPEAEQ